MQDRRRYRFRVWVKPDGKMYPVVSIVRGGVVIQDDELIRTSHREQVEMMQYSGLKDSAGIEIYEKDILQAEAGQLAGQGFRVDFEEGAFKLESLAGRIGQIILNQAVVEQNSLRIHGNIYEGIR